ncbi:hypothetical protein JCM5296_004608 [Sporobolomyces johnsonii]
MSLSPRHASHLLHLLLSLSTTSWVLSLVSLILSPSHLLIFILRAVLQFQYTNPRRAHPNRSLRFFLAVWAVGNAVPAAVHATAGSQGTKGPRGWAQRGLILDFIGQAVIPSTPHLLFLDALIALVQLTTILIAFGATVPSDLDATTGTEPGGEAARDYSALLGVTGTTQPGVDDEEQEADEDEGTEPGRGARGRRKAGYEGLAMHDSDEGDDDDEVDGLSSYTPAKPPYPFSSDLIRLPPIARLRLRTVWKEVATSTDRSAREAEDRAVEDEEAGRGRRMAS